MDIPPITDAELFARHHDRIQAFGPTPEEWRALEAAARPFVDRVQAVFGDSREDRARAMVALFGRLLATMIGQASFDDAFVYTAALNAHFALAVHRHGGPPLRLRTDPELAQAVGRYTAQEAAAGPGFA